MMGILLTCVQERAFWLGLCGFLYMDMFLGCGEGFVGSWVMSVGGPICFIVDQCILRHFCRCRVAAFEASQELLAAASVVHMCCDGRFNMHFIAR